MCVCKYCAAKQKALPVLGESRVLV